MNTEAPSQDVVDLVAALNMFGDRIPLLTQELDQLRATIPRLARDAMLGDLRPAGWLALADRLECPGEMLADLAKLCRQQVAGPQGANHSDRV